MGSEFGKVHILRDEKINEFERDLRKAREEAEEISQEKCLQNTKIIHTPESRRCV